MHHYSNMRVVDPICGMEVTVSESAISFNFLGVTYFFCSDECREQFRRVPERHLVNMAHEPENEFYGYCCPTQRLLQLRPLPQDQ